LVARLRPVSSPSPPLARQVFYISWTGRRPDVPSFPSPFRAVVGLHLSFLFFFFSGYSARPRRCVLLITPYKPSFVVSPPILFPNLLLRPPRIWLCLGAPPVARRCTELPPHRPFPLVLPRCNFPCSRKILFDGPDFVPIFSFGVPLLPHLSVPQRSASLTPPNRHSGFLTYRATFAPPLNFCIAVRLTPKDCAPVFMAQE